MPYLHLLYDTNFLEYASYVIKDRAIPHIDDGFKPVQRRIIHSLREMDDGKFNKVANVVGHCMKYHPHGDASIFSALVVIANKEMFIEKQGNFGNIYTGDSASAARYIECRLNGLAHDVLFHSEITEYVDSYDGRNKEPVVFPAKIPVLLAQGSDGIAVGMATKILPHNLIELIQAEISCLKGRSFTVLPDFQTGGLMDASEYDDGNGKILVRCRLEVKDQKSIIIREVPYGVTTENLIASIESASRKNKVRVSSIEDYTAEHVEIELKVSRGVRAEEVIDSLYAFTDCETSISANLLVILDKNPRVTTVTEVIKRNSGKLVEILRAELKVEQKHLEDRLHSKTLEQIFIENKIYRNIEKQETREKVVTSVDKGLKPFQNQIKREVTEDDIETLLKIPIRRISLYDINKANREMREIKKRLKEIRHSLDNIIDFSIDFLKGLIVKYKKMYPRKTEIIAIDQVDAKDVAKRDMKLRYNKQTGYLGHDVNGDTLMEVSPFDKVLVIRKSGIYSVIDVPEKLFVDKGMVFCGFIDAERIYNVIYKNQKTDLSYIKRCRIEKFILNKVYNIIPDDSKILDFTTKGETTIHLEYKPKPRLKSLQEKFTLSEYPIRGNKAGGLKLSSKETKKGKFKS